MTLTSNFMLARVGLYCLRFKRRKSARRKPVYRIASVAICSTQNGAIRIWLQSLIFVFAHAWLVTQLANPNWMFFASVAHFASLGFLSRTFFGIAMLDQEERGKIKEN